jgi:hypothetical protein|eukprot:COSAG01_NODE_4834_length_4701_cov_158.807692_5_plen_102_part_00
MTAGGGRGLFLLWAFLVTRSRLRARSPKAGDFITSISRSATGEQELSFSMNVCLGFCEELFDDCGTTNSSSPCHDTSSASNCCQSLGFSVTPGASSISLVG